jgi:hypothetical protein
VVSEPEREPSQEFQEERSDEQPESRPRKLHTRGQGVGETHGKIKSNSKPSSKSTSNVDKRDANRKGKGAKAPQESDQSDQNDEEEAWIMETQTTNVESQEEEQIVGSRKGKDITREETKPKRSRSQSRAETQDEDAEHPENSQQVITKKRKMIPFPTSQPTNLQWSQFSLVRLSLPILFDYFDLLYVKGDGGLNIPTALSPIKEGQAQELSTTSGLLSRVGSVFGVRKR